MFTGILRKKVFDLTIVGRCRAAAKTDQVDTSPIRRPRWPAMKKFTRKAGKIRQRRPGGRAVGAATVMRVAGRSLGMTTTTMVPTRDSANRRQANIE